MESSSSFFPIAALILIKESRKNLETNAEPKEERIDETHCPIFTCTLNADHP